MLIHKRSSRLRVTLRADRINLRCRFQILVIETPMRVVTVRAGDQPFFHLVMERLIELRLHIGMALEAQRRL